MNFVNINLYLLLHSLAFINEVTDNTCKMFYNIETYNTIYTVCYVASVSLVWFLHGECHNMTKLSSKE